MGMKENSEAEKGLDLNPDEEENIWVQTESNPSHSVHNKLEEAAEFKPKFRSVIPAKRKLVKTMILNDIVQFWSKISDPSFFQQGSNIKHQEDDQQPCFSSLGVGDVVSYSNSSMKMFSLP